jgi:hypothetical protein
MASRVLTVRGPDVCARCGAAVAKGDEAWWDAEAKTVTCLECHGGTESVKPVEANELDRGIAGESAAREHGRRRANREQALKINGRDWTRLLDGLDRQVAAVRDALAGTLYLHAKCDFSDPRWVVSNPGSGIQNAPMRL